MNILRKMKLTTPLFLFGFIVMVAALMIPSPPVEAANCDGTVLEASCCAGVDVRIDVGCKEDESPIFAYAKAIIRFLSGIIGIAVIGAIIFFGIMYTTANGDAGQTKKAVEGIRNSIIGLILFIFTFAILQFLVPGGLFETPASNSGGGVDPQIAECNLRKDTEGRSGAFAWENATSKCVERPCSAASLTACTTKAKCDNLGSKYVFSGSPGQCGATGNQCGKGTLLNNCKTSAQCTGVGGFWYKGSDNTSACFAKPKGS